MIRPDINTAARTHCNALQRGATWTQAIGAGMQTPYGQYWYAGANDENRTWLAEQYANALRVLCPAIEERALNAHRRNRDSGSPTYTGGNTTISEDPFEF